ncbi:MAG: hypothetical protein JSV31_32245 [Desulfobacterales bacterium]|nr:MAG: hypothetical protein JSV31_32245 [Desulfobacterales bacterium]
MMHQIRNSVIPGTIPAIPGTPYFFKVSPLLELVDDWGKFIGGQIAERDISLLRRHERTGRPLGGERFIDGLERVLRRSLRKQKPGPKPNRGSR